MKKILSVILSLVMIFSITSGIGISAQAEYDYSGFNQKLNQLRVEYPEGMTWTNSNSYPSGWYGCWAFANICAERIFGYKTPRNNWNVVNVASTLPGDVITTGTHTMFVINVVGDTITVAEGNYAGKIHWGRQFNKYSESFTVYRSPNYNSVIGQVVPSGSEMTAGYDRAIPDGDYLIANAGTTDKTSFYYLDIKGTDQPAVSGTNVILSGPLSKEPASYDYDIWTIKYSNGFYTIVQKGTDMSLDVWGIDKSNEANIGVSKFNGGSNQKWAISRNSNNNGYRIQAKHSGYSVDVAGGGTNAGTNIRQNINNSTNAQTWFFVPYKPSQTLEEGRYVLISAMGDSVELDIPGNTGNIDENTNVQIWDANKAESRYNSFDVKKLNNGYYKLTHSASGKGLDVSNAVSKFGTNIALHTSNDSVAQQWAITKDGYNGGYVIRAKCSGLAVDVYGALTDNGTKVIQSPFHGNKNQTWRFVKAEYSIKYNANGGTGVPSAQKKYYNSEITLSKNKPTRTNYRFIGWNTKSDGSGLAINPGAVYGLEMDITLYAQWEQLECNHISDNGTITKQSTYTATGIKTYKCTVCKKTLKTEIIPKLEKRTNPIKASGKTATVKYSAIKKKNQTIAKSKAFNISKAKGKVTFKKSSGNKKITVSSAGKITVKKGLKKGTYKIKVKVKAAGNDIYKSKTVSVTVTIKVK